VEQEGGYGGRVVGRGVELGEMAATELGVDAVGHVAGEEEVGVVYFEGVAGCGEASGLLDKFWDGEGGVRGVVIPGFQALA
jgi:hypothetical protein